MSMFRWLVVCCAILVCALVVAEVRDVATGENFPHEVSFDYEGRHVTLQLTGMTTRKKFFVNVYNVAHYLQAGASVGGNAFQAILNDDVAKQLTLKWVRTVDADRVREGYAESFRKVLTASEYGQLQGDVAQFLGYFTQEVKKGDEHVLRWLPGGQVQVIIKGNLVGHMASPAFAKGLWSIWLGDKAVVDRDKLVSLIK